MFILHFRLFWAICLNKFFSLPKIYLSKWVFQFVKHLFVVNLTENRTKGFLVTMNRRIHWWSTRPFLASGYPRMSDCRGDLQNFMSLKYMSGIYKSMNIYGIHESRNIFPGQTMSAGSRVMWPAWNSTFFGLPRPSTCAHTDFDASVMEFGQQQNHKARCPI